MVKKTVNSKTIFCSIAIFLLPLILSAQNIDFTASCDRTQVELGETFTLEVKVGGNISNAPEPKLPQMSDFDIVSTGRMENVSIVNGKVSSAISFNYTLSPRKIGKFTIPPCTMTYKGKSIQTQPIDIEVTKSAAPTQSSSQSTNTPNLPKKGTGQKDVFATLTISGNKAYANEQLILSMKFYQGVNLSSSPSYNPPSLTGFLTENLGQTQNYEVVSGRRYLVNEIKYAIFPMSAGVYKIGSASIRYEVEDFFSFPFGGETRVATTNPLEITVTNLPSKGKPTDFSGAVGKFEMSSKLDNAQVKQWEPASLSITINGEGNIKSIETPKLPELPDFKVYCSGSDVKSNTSKNKIAGQKVFKIILVPQREGKFEIPPVNFSYFDPSIGGYKTLTTGNLSLSVSAGTKSQAYVASPDGQPVEVVGQDIQYIKTELNLNKEDNYFYKNKIFLFIQILPLLALLIAFVSAKRKERLLTDKAYARAVGADKTRKKGLAKCQKALTKGISKEFYDEVHRILIGYISGKLNIPAPALTTDVAMNRLKEKNIDEELLKRFHNLLSTCELAKFGLGELKNEEMNKNYKELTELLTEFSKKL
ncbi:MAG: BatD family protein [bacterium]|nr:BatD family protein [bacterium]